MAPKVSVIIPCYNAEKTIKNTLDSLKGQVYKNFKVILINDGSLDRTIEIIEKYINQNQFMDITLKTCDNGGVSRARNIGMMLCDTEYISFLDADDMYHPMFLERLVSELENHKADISMCIYCQDKFKPSLNHAVVMTLSPEHLLERYFYKRKYKLNLWGALYKRTLLKQHEIFFWDGMKYGEDSEFFCKYLYHCRNAVFINEELYCYVNRSDSAQHKISYNKVQNIEGFKRILGYWGNKAPSGSEYIIARAIWSCLKDFAIGNCKYYQKIQDEYDVKNAMRLLVKVEQEKTVRYSAMAYLVHPTVFKVLIYIAARSMYGTAAVHSVKDR